MKRRQAEIEAFNNALWAAIGDDVDTVLDIAQSDSGYVGEVSDFAVSLTEVKTRFGGSSQKDILAMVMSEVDDEDPEASFSGHRGFSGDMD